MMTQEKSLAEKRNCVPDVASRAEASAREGAEPLLRTRDVTVTYDTFEALHKTSLTFEKGQVTALIGPSGCGKSTFLRCLNLMNREIPKCKVAGQIDYHGRDINTRSENLFDLRKSIGMVFQQPTPFRKSIRDNILFAPKKHGRLHGKDEEDELVETSLRQAALWDEVKDKLDQSAHALSGGQQQRLCIARTLAMHPDVVLFDEPCSALDPISTFSVEETIRDIAQTGIVLTGGGSLLYGFDKLISERTEIACSIADDADSCVANGCGRSLQWISSMQEGTINLARRKLMKEQ